MTSNASTVDFKPTVDDTLKASEDPVVQAKIKAQKANEMFVKVYTNAVGFFASKS